MATFTPNSNLYKWQTTDTKQTTITEMANNGDKLDAKLLDHDTKINNNTTSLADKATKTFVTYKDFGAVLDGVTDDTVAIKACHDYANTNNLKVVQNQGSIFITNTITVQTSTDLTGCTLVITPACQNKTLYNITSKITPITVTGVNQAELVRFATQIPSLSNYKHNMVTIVSDQLLCVRQNSGATNVYRGDSFFLTRDGAMTNGKLLHDFTTGNLTITAYPYEDKHLTFKGLSISWNFNVLADTCTVVKLTRGNATLKNMILRIPNTVDYNDTSGSGFKNYAFYITNAYNVTVENIIAENIAEGVGMSGYIMQMDNVLNVTFRNLTWLNGWGATGTNNVKNWKVYDSSINRIDVHQSGGDIYCNNVDFIGGWGVYLGYGDGRVILDNCKSDFINIDGRQNDSVVFLDITYGVIFQGDIIIKNHKIISRSNRNRYIMCLAFQGTGLDYKNAYDLQLPNLITRDIKFEGTGAEKLYGYYVSGVNTMSNTLTANGRSFGYPNRIDIQGVNLNIDSDTSYFQAISLLVNGGGLPQANFKAGGTRIILRDIFQTVHSGYKSGFTTAQLSNLYQKPLVDVTDLFSDTTQIIHSLLIDNCGGTVHFEAKTSTIKIINSEVSSVDVEGGVTQAPTRFIVWDSDWYMYPNSGLTLSVIDNVNLDAQNNIMHMVKKDGTNLPFYELSTAGTAKKLFRNIFADSDASQTIVDKYYKYLDTTVYKSPTTL